ncbi:RNA 3'-terminal phosphate cyclase [Pontixanthobacter sp. CEM42]|uniref:RNA 3'-terminal phosphate cyclase n=1 Tax=Pontixanthobacter sp. CEM42 TaxID=2792077 RepID=UPI001AE0E8A9|nr:RNA 3'-terminal phosphate cyclase [Pontixanthobacter sp. CEM42]
MITIDGSEGEGGGQVLRNSCALSLITGEAFTIDNIRGKRAKPGLMRQHLTSIQAACQISTSDCDGLEMRSSKITFRPGKVVPGEYSFAVGTAGSTGLVLQTILMPLIYADGPSRVTIEGGTHAAMAPPFDFLEKCYLPIIDRMGPTVSAKIVRHGFYPRGGGKIVIDIDPAPLRAIDCMDRGELISRSGMMKFAGIPFDIAERMIKASRKTLTDWREGAFIYRDLPDSEGPGMAILFEAEYENVTEVVAGFGKIGVKAERIGKSTAARIAGYIGSTAFAGPYLQDQLLLPFAIAGGGKFTSVKISQHTLTAADIIERFTGRATRFSKLDDGTHLVEVGG